MKLCDDWFDHFWSIPDIDGIIECLWCGLMANAKDGPK